MLNEFDKDYSPTIGIDFFTKPIQVRDHTVNLQIWDTAGQERFRSLVPSYIRDSSIAILVYDVSDQNSFDEAKKWHKVLVNERGSDAICILVGNKNDLESKVPQDQVLGFARPLGIVSVEASAKTGQNVSRLFKVISESIPDISRPPPDPIAVTKRSTTGGEGSSCLC
jgi:small GTP-binding protein